MSEMWLHTDKEAIHAFSATCCKEHKLKVAVAEVYKKGGKFLRREIDGMPESDWRAAHAKTKKPPLDNEAPFA